MPTPVTLWNHIIYNPTEGEAPEAIGFALTRSAALAALLASWAAGQIERAPSTGDEDSLSGVVRIAQRIHATLAHMQRQEG
jgi:hypothetical protein